jgi:hypothetical protein
VRRRASVRRQQAVGRPLRRVAGHEPQPRRTARRTDRGGDAEHRVRDVGPIVARIHGPMGEEPAASAAGRDETGPHGCADREDERRVLHGAAARDERMAERDRIVARPSEAAHEADDGDGAADGVRGCAGGAAVDVNGVNGVDEPAGVERDGSLRRGEDVENGIRPAAAQRVERRRRQDRVAEVGELDHQDVALRPRGRLARCGRGAHGRVARISCAAPAVGRRLRGRPAWRPHIAAT